MAQTFNCPSCGAPLETDGKETNIHCEYCGETVIVPPELRAAAGTSVESIPSASPEPFEAGSQYGKMTASQVRQMMMSIRAGQLDDAAKAFQAGTGATDETANQTVQSIANQIAASNRILPAELAAIMMQYAQTVNRSSQPGQAAPTPRPRRGGIGCGLTLVIILLFIYFAYTSLSPLNLAKSVFAGNKNDPVLQTAVAPIHQVETAVAPVFRPAATPSPSSANPASTILSFGGAGVGQSPLPLSAVLPFQAMNNSHR